MNRPIGLSQHSPVKYILLCMVIFFVLVFSGKSESQTINAPAWEPPPDGFDWIQLSSDEWLKGTLKVLYEKRLEFDSDKLGFREFDWKDIKQIRGNDYFSMRFEKQVIVSGFLRVIEDKVFITTGDGVKEFERNKLVTITRSDTKRNNYWTAKLGLGLNISKGNTDQIQYNMKGTLKRRSLKTRFVFDYLGNFVSTDNENTADNQRISSYFDIFRTRYFFYRPLQVEYYRDPFQNIQYRGTVGASVGYHFIDSSKTNWDIKAGPAYQFTRFKSVEEGKDLSETTPALSVGSSYDTELTSKLDLIANYTANFVNDKSGRYTHHVITTLEAEITDSIDFDISLVWERTQKPILRSDGTLPKQDDFQLIFSVSIDF